jgi:hypothetical protein
MTRDELKDELAGLKPGQCTGIHYDAYSKLFPPGEPSEEAREASYAFAKTAGCVLENIREEQAVWFVKSA